MDLKELDRAEVACGTAPYSNSPKSKQDTVTETSQRQLSCCFRSKAVVSVECFFLVSCGLFDADLSQIGMFTVYLLFATINCSS